MENNNKIIAALAGLSAVLIALNWSRIKRVAGKTKDKSMDMLHATINHLKPHKVTATPKKKSRKATEELVASAIKTNNKVKADASQGKDLIAAKDSNNQSVAASNNSSCAAISDKNGLDRRIIDFLKGNGNGGYTLPQLGEKLDTPYIKLAKPVKRLLEQGDIHKEGKLYLYTDTV